MGERLIKIVESTVIGQRAASFTNSGDDIYEDRLNQVVGFDYTPHCIYFTYVGFDTTTMKVVVEHYFYPGGNPDATAADANFVPIDLPKDTGPSRLKDLIAALAANAVGAKNNPTPYEYNFKDLVWKRKSYMVFLFDDIVWKMHKYRSNREAVIFFDDKYRIKYSSNHSFYDGIDYEDIPVTKNGATTLREAIVFINHMKQVDGSDLGPQDTEPYQFGIFFDVEFSSGGGSVPFVVDPGGTNQGPPLLP